MTEPIAQASANPSELTYGTFGPGSSSHLNMEMFQRMHRNLVAIALANKLARIAWAVLARGRAYQPVSLPHAA